MLISCIGGDCDSSFLGFVIEKGTKSQIHLCIHEHDVSVIFKSSKTVFSGRADRIGSFYQNIDRTISEELSQIGRRACSRSESCGAM